MVITVTLIMLIIVIIVMNNGTSRHFIIFCIESRETVADIEAANILFKGST